MEMPMETVPVPREALSMLRWLMLSSWTLFPIADTYMRIGGISTEQAEHLFCAADYAAKVKGHCCVSGSLSPTRPRGSSKNAAVSP